MTDELKALGKRYGLKQGSRALAVFVAEAGGAALRTQTYDDAAWRISASRLAAFEEQLAINALRKLFNTETASGAAVAGFVTYDEPDLAGGSNI